MRILGLTYWIRISNRLKLILSILVLPFLINAQSWQELHKMGKKNYQEGKYEEAYENFLSAQRQAPENVDLSKDIGTAAYRMGDYDSASDIFTRSAQKSDINKVDRAKKWHNVGNSQMKQKKYAGAVESYKNALRLNPDNQQTRYNYAEAKRRLAQQENNQDQDNDQNSDDSDSQNNQNDNQESESSQDDSQNNSQDDSQNNNQEDKSSSGDQGKNQQNQRNDTKNQRSIDKTLEELLKREMETKKKVEGYKKGKESESKSNKKW